MDSSNTYVHFFLQKILVHNVQGIWGQIVLVHKDPKERSLWENLYQHSKTIPTHLKGLIERILTTVSESLRSHSFIILNVESFIHNDNYQEKTRSEKNQEKVTKKWDNLWQKNLFFQKQREDFLNLEYLDWVKRWNLQNLFRINKQGFQKGTVKHIFPLKHKDSFLNASRFREKRQPNDMANQRKRYE